MDKTILVITALNLLVSGASLTALIVGGRHVEQKMAETEKKANDAIRKLKRTLEDIEI